MYCESPKSGLDVVVKEKDLPGTELRSSNP
jgi:hypothetical protein